MISLQFIDTPQFKRLQHLKQLESSWKRRLKVVGRVGVRVDFVDLQVAMEMLEFEKTKASSADIRLMLNHRCLETAMKVEQTTFENPQEVIHVKRMTGILPPTGLTYLYYPGDVHSRFEHSVGVYWLANEAVNRLMKYQGSELDIDHVDVQTANLAGLLHDVGHGPFSYMFEKEFIPRAHHGCKWSNEEMSVKMIDYIVDEHNIDVDADVKKVQDIIASQKSTSPTVVGEKRFMYDIVANGRYSIGADNIDYVVRDCRACALRCNLDYSRILDATRVIDDEICYEDKEVGTIWNLFSSDGWLNQLVHMDSRVEAIELMILDAMVKANDKLQLTSYIEDPALYWKLDDTIVETIETSNHQDLKESRDLILRVRNGDLYKLCEEYHVPHNKLCHFKDVTPKDIICSQTYGSPTNEEDIHVSNIRMDLTRGGRKIFKSINFFKDNDSQEKFHIGYPRECHADKVVRVYTKTKDPTLVTNAFKKFLRETYGEELFRRTFGFEDCWF